MDRGASRGFTLIELMIVVAIIGILAAIAIPKFAEMLRKSNEGATRGNLGALRSALTIYYADMEGVRPSDPASLTINGKYLSAIPSARAPNYHPAGSAIALRSFAQGVSEAGAWVYDADSTEAHYGEIFVDCTHTDSKNTTWASY